ncbi:MAG: GH92 family glycosyl hydrolase [Bacteroidia bacterium]|nr:GH92 family glycosyl hydrolase [Bacteroidia bacterium]
MKTNFSRLLIFGSLTILISAFAPAPEKKSNLDYVDPYIGGMGHLLHPTRPNVQLPNQMIRMHPMRADFLDDQISSFPLTMISHRAGELFGVLPGTGTPKSDNWKARQTYDHDLEIVRPYYFSTYLIDEDIKTEFAPGNKVGYFRFTFPSKSNKTLRFQINQEGHWEFFANNTLVGEEQFFGMKAYVYGEFNQNGSAQLKSEPRFIKKTNKTKQEPTAWIEFSKDEPKPVEFKYAISFISVEQAKANLKNELSSWDFDGLKNKGEQVWAEAMNQIEVKGATEAQRRTFYTSLYRTYERMVNINEYGHYYSSYDKKVHATDRDFYIDDWVWDTYLANHPLRMMLQPKKESDMLNSYTQMYEQSGWMPQFPLLHIDNPAMNGFHSTIVFLDAYRKGIKGYNVEKAYEGTRRNGYEATLLPWRNGIKCSLDTFYREKGFYPALMPGEVETVKEVDSFEKRQSVAITLGASYDDWALSEMAKELGHKKDQDYFHKQSTNYRNLYRPEKTLMWPKNAKGDWIEIDPKFDGGPGGRDYYDENNGYTYQWQVQEDIHGLVKLMGGREKFTANLDQLFREDLGRTKFQFWAKFADATGMVGQYSMGNEPSFHIPWLYNYAGEPWKTQKRVRFLLDVWFQDNIFGIPGDEDGGGMTAFVVFASMGFYPVTPGLPIYNIGSPVFEEVKIKQTNGKTFTIKAHNYAKGNKYIQSAKLNGQPLNKPWFTHAELLNGATIELEMGDYPNKKWGASVDAAPPSSIE